MEVYFEPVALSLIAPQILTFISPLDIEFFFFPEGRSALG